MATEIHEIPKVAADGPLFRISLRLYHQLAESNWIGPEDKVVLLDGLLVKAMTKGPRHSTATRKGMKALETILPKGWHVRMEQPISLTGGPEGADSEPEPDLVIVRGGDDAYLNEHPGPSDIGLIVEIADSSLIRDRAGLARFGWAKIPAVWIVHLAGQTIEAYTLPTGPTTTPAYLQMREFGKDDSLPVPLDGVNYGPLALSKLLF